MKKRIALFLVFCFCISMFLTTTGFAVEENTTNIGFQPGSAGVRGLDENGNEFFISGNEILSYGTPETSMAPPSSDLNGRSLVATTDYSPVVYIECTFINDNDSEDRKTTFGSGAFVGPTGILTCAHALYEEEYGWAEEVVIYSNYSKNLNTVSYKNKYTKKMMYIGGEYAPNNSHDDWGFIEIYETSKDGYYGYKQAESAEEVDRLPVTLVGYAAPNLTDISPVKKYKSEGVLKVSTNMGRSLPMVYSTCSVRKGVSGGPYLEGAYVRAIETQRKHGFEESVGLLINAWLKNFLDNNSGR